MSDKRSAKTVSARLYQRAEQVFPGGITRATIPCDPEPNYVARGEGAWLIEADGRRLLDLNNNFTTLIHGHAFPPVIEALCNTARLGTCFSGPTESEIRLAETIISRAVGMERIRFVNTGTEAVMFAIKAARAYTGRPAIAKVEGAYHGSYDWAELPSAPDSQADWPMAVGKYRGTPTHVPGDVVLLRLNDLDGTERALIEAKDRLGAILIDPMPSRAGLIAPEPNYVALLHDLAQRFNLLIIADEVLNFRQSLAGASPLVGLRPDLWALGKIIGGGLPIGAIAGRADVMEVFAESGPGAIAQGGTFSANPLSMTAGLVCLEHLGQDAMERLNEMGTRLRSDLRTLCERHEAPFTVTGNGSLFIIHPKAVAPREARDARLSPQEAEMARNITRHFRDCGIVLPFNAAACLSTAMEAADLDRISATFDSFLTQMVPRLSA